MLIPVFCLATLSHTALERYRQKLLCLDSKLHRQFVEHILGISVDDESDGLLGRYAALVAVEELVLRYLRRRSLVFHCCCAVLNVKVWECMRATMAAEQ